MAREHEPAARPAETAARHYAVLQELRRSPGGDPLSATAPDNHVNVDV